MRMVRTMLANVTSAAYGFKNPALKQEFMSKHYPDDYAPYSTGEMPISQSVYGLKNQKGYTHLSDPAPMSWYKHLRGKWLSGMQLFPNFVPYGKLLEVGCASGNRLALLRKLGWSDCLGIEYNELAAKIARENGFVVYSGRVEDMLQEISNEFSRCDYCQFCDGAFGESLLGDEFS